MDPRYGGQDIVRCTVCETVVAPMHCEVCHIDLCKDCVEAHLADQSKVHKVVSLKQFLSSPKCPVHATKHCELHCKQCDVPICSQCVISKAHKDHDVVEMMENFKNKQTALRKDLEEIEKVIYPKFQKSEAFIKRKKTDRRKHFQKLKKDLNEQGEALHKEIDNIIQSMQTEIDEMDEAHLKALDKHENQIKSFITECKHIISDLKLLLEGNDFSSVSNFKSKIEYFRKCPPKLKISLPIFKPKEIKRNQLVELLGSLSHLSIETEVQGYTVPSSGAEFCHQDRPLLDVPQLITELKTGFASVNDVICLSDEEILVRCGGSIRKLYLLQGELVKSVQIRSGDWIEGIAVTRSGDLVCTDYAKRSINLLINNQVQTLIRLQGWIPRNICVASSGDFLVFLVKDTDAIIDEVYEPRVARYSGSTEKQSIQLDDQGKLLYLSGSNIIENRNLDICVVDWKLRSVTVVNSAGKLRFKYRNPPFATKKLFSPCGITTDSQSRILVTDCDNHSIHIVDQDGQFLQLINNCDLNNPWCLCIDSRDDIFVGEMILGHGETLHVSGKLKKIRYCL
uniref:Uncharacterized protein LOC111115348 n=1 Tax=Crassostrea virginica TaxID=6565 RepID=A0A8B8C268_CRAVI|nr:uncharacterized protein LOC111115348 [Crassostrea virginica]